MTERDVLDAISFEIEATTKPISATIASVNVRSRLTEVFIQEDTKGVDESLEEAVAWWGPGRQANVLAVTPDENKVVFCNMSGSPPMQGEKIKFYKPKYLEKLRDIWEHAGKSAACLKVLSALSRPQLQSLNCNDKLFPTLRPKQQVALALRKQQVGFLWGPPGTGKTFTLGALVATILIEQPTLRILLLSTTNRAVDEALLSVDKRLEDLRLKSREAEVIRKRVRRYGQNFDAGRYQAEQRQHLVADNSSWKIIFDLAELEAKEPSKVDPHAYYEWRKRLDALRSRLPKPDHHAALLAMTTTAAAYAFDNLQQHPFDYVIFDEASQISLPYACALGTLGKRLIFAGDDKQLAPIVVAKHPVSQRILGLSPFVYKKETNCCQLDEQNRMTADICEVVANVFYDGHLHVDENSERNPTWQAERRVSKLASLGRRRLHVEVCATSGGFSTQGGTVGVFRPESARRAVELAKECFVSQSGTIAILTPFRKQKRDIDRLIRAECLQKSVTVATIHSVQGGEFHTVIFDPVLGEPVRPDGKLLSDEREAPRLINVALSRAQARFIVLLSASDRSNGLLQQLADAIEMNSTSQEYEEVSEMLNEQSFPEAFAGRYVRHGKYSGRLLTSDKAGEFILLTRNGERRSFRIDVVRAAFTSRQIT